MFLVDLIDKETSERPHAVALVLEDGRTVSYADLKSKSDVICTYLCNILYKNDYSASVVSNPLVTIMIRRDVAFIVSILAVLKAGAAYVPVDPTFPPDRQSYILTHSQCSVLLIDQETLSEAKSLNVSLPEILIIIDSHTGLIVNCNDFDVESTNYSMKRQSYDDTNLAYVLYTSGSTGKPKGVMVKNIGVLNIINWFAEELCINHSSRMLCLTTFCFDISMLEIFVPLTRGAILVLANSKAQKDPFRLLDLMKKFGVTTFQATPTTYEMMMATGWTGDMEIDFLIGGEAFRSSLLPICKNCRSIRNVYGPTETTIWSSCYLLPKNFNETIVPIGKPISETDFYIVEEKDDLCDKRNKWSLVEEEGKEGELWIGGVGVAKGYLHAEHLTEEKFLLNPFGKEGTTVYRTGDIVKMQLGNYYFVRRMDDQVKIDGYRIELQEIESVYMKSVDIDQAVALVRNGKLVIYLKIKSESKIKPRQIVLDSVKLFVSKSLTHYMIPKYTMVVESFPLTANGKLDKKSLPDPEDYNNKDIFNGNESSENDAVDIDSDDQSDSCLIVNPINESNREPPIITVTSRLCKIVERIKGFKPTVHFTFASLGIDSLTAVMFVKQISDDFEGLRIDPSLVFAPGMTIKLLGFKLEEKLLIEKPEIFPKLGISKSSETISEPLEDDENHPSEVDIAFEICISSNLRLLEGVRGVFVLLILWDHYHPQSIPLSETWGTDTGLFVLLSGYVASLQLRMNPKFKTDPVTKKKVLKVRSKFDWLNFIVSRAIGIFPVLWFAIVCWSPFWYQQDNPPSINASKHAFQFIPHAPGLPQSYISALCTALYVFGLQSWVRPACHISGPNMVLYGSIIWSIFILYSVSRIVFSRIQDNLIQRRSNTKEIDDIIYSPREFINNYSVLIEMIDLEANNSHNKSSSSIRHSSHGHQLFTKLCDIVSLLTYNRAISRKMVVIVVFTWFLIIIIILTLLWRFGYAKNSIVYYPVFICGLLGASALELIHCFNWIRNRNYAHSDSNISIVNLCSVFNIYQGFDSEYHQLQDNNINSSTRVSTFWKNNNFLNLLLGQFFPDLIGISFFILMSNLELLKNFSKTLILYWIVVPVVVLLFLIISMLQVGKSRHNFSRLILETKIMNFFGYISFPLYLLQRIFLEFYLPRYYSSIDGPIRLFSVWFDHKPIMFRLFWIFIIILLSWAVQRVMSDIVGGYLYGIILPMLHKCKRR